MGKKNKKRQVPRPQNIQVEAEMKDPGETTPMRKNKKSKNKKKYEKANKAKSNKEKFHLKQGILNSLFDEDDADMGQGREQIQPPTGGKPRIGKSAKERLRKVVIGNSASDAVEGWHKISVVPDPPLGKPGITVESVLQAVAASFMASPPHPSATFRPYSVQVEKHRELSFIVQRVAVANSLKDTLDGNYVALESGFQAKLQVKTRSFTAPRVDLNTQSMEAVKRVLGTRYRNETRALNLSDFVNDPGLVTPSGGYLYAPLSRSSVMSAVVDIICDNIPDVVAIDFSNNKLPTLEHFANLVDRADSLKIIYLANNRLSDVSQLQKMRSLRGLEEMKLSGNPMTKKFNSQEGFENAVQTIFPSLKLLDDKPLKKLITFDDGEESGSQGPELPVSVKKMCPSAVESVVLQFIQQYFQVYDTDDRSPLEAAYHQEALFSVTSAYPPGSTGHGETGLDKYLSSSRNLMKHKAAGQRLRRLIQGRAEVAKFLCFELPKTRHDLDSFSLDVPLATPAMVCVTLTGVFVERTSLATASSPISPNGVRHFARTFNLVPAGSGVVIVNETLHVTVATKFQSKMAFSTSAKATPVPSASLEDLVRQLMTKTKMNADWAKTCLQQCGFNIEQAISAFETAHKEGKIPQEAYL